MKKLRFLAALALSSMIAGTLLADDAPKAPAKDKPAAGGHAIAVPVPMIKIPGVEWTEEQQQKIKELQKEFAPKVLEASKKMEGMLTAEQKKARDEAVKAAKEAGKKPQEIIAAVQEAINLTDDQKKQVEQVKEEMQAAQKEFFQKVMGLLTPEQKQALREKQKEMQKGKPAESKEKADQ
jgi:hypothetical protein